MSTYKFTDLNPSEFSGKTLVVDIDGTLVADGEKELSGERERALMALKACAGGIYLSTNKEISEWHRKLSQRLAIPLVSENAYKPSPKVLSSLSEKERSNLVIIGDKYLTDGLLAKRARVPFVKVERLKSGKENLLIRLSYILDDIISAIGGR